MQKTSSKKMGLVAVTGLVVANVMGSGIALLPAQLAAFGGITIISWIITLIGAIALALVFAELGAEERTVGGPVAYAKEVAPVFGFQSGVIYYMANWIGNIAIAMTGVSYLATFVPILAQPIPATIASIAIIWIMTILNFFGGEWISKIATIGVTCMLIPVIATAIFGWFKFDTSVYAANWNVAQNSSTGMTIMQGVLLCLWSFIGIESASVSSGNINNPKKTVPRATMIGVVFSGLIYIASSQVMLGMFPASDLGASTAPFALSTGTLVGSWVKPVVSFITMMTCFTALSSWMLLVSESAQTSAEAGDFPKVFKDLNKKGVPAKGLVLTSLMMTGLLLFFTVIGSASRGSGDIFKDVINIAVLLTMIPYVYSAMNLFRFGEKKRKGILVLGAAVLAMVFCLVAIIGGGAVSITGTFITSLVVLLFYARKEGIEQRNRAEARKHKKEEMNNEHNTNS